MKSEIIQELSKITEEEQAALCGDSRVNQEIYTDSFQFQIDSEKFLEQGTRITVRPHTRFVDFPEHWHNYIEIMYVCQGSITHLIDHKKIVLHAGDLLFLNQHVRHKVERAGENDIGINLIALPEFFDIPYNMLDKNNILAEFLISTLRRSSTDPQYLVFHTSENRYIDNLMENIATSLLHRDDQYNINQITMGLVFLHIVANIDMVGKESSQSYRDIVINTALRYIRNNYRDATLGALAESLHQSEAALSRMIKRHTGVTFKQLLQRQKFQRAVELLVETPLSTAEIMEAVGYENSSYFHNQFRERYDMSPREYRLIHKNDKEIHL